MRSEKVGSDTMLARIVKMVADAQRSRAPIQRLVDTVSGWFVPGVIVVAIVAFIVRSLLGSAPAMAYGIRSEEHTSELKYLMRIQYAVFSSKKNNTRLTSIYTQNATST